MLLSAVDKQGWLRGIQFAQDSHVTAPHQQQQQLMVVFFSDGRQLILSYFSYPKLYPVPQSSIGYCSSLL
jgi:hypothetical protein